jgi:2-iminobutanoate/2-iminopropanoate deaminase
MIFASVQIPINPQTDQLVEGGIEKQTEQSLQNLKAVLKPYLIDLKNIVKVTIFLRDMNNFPKVNEIYSKYFDSQFPARSCIEVSRLPEDAQIEIEVIAYCEET